MICFRSALPILAAGCLFLSAAAATAQAPAPAPAAPAPAPAAKPDPVVATVNGQQIRLSDVEQAQASLPQQYRQFPLPMIFAALLDQLIDTKLVAAEGRKAKVQDDAEFKRRLALIEDQLIQQSWLQGEIDKRVTKEAVAARYQQKVKEIPVEDEVKARHILVATEDEAKAVLEQLRKGGDFAAIAKEKSTDKASGAQGGDLGWFKKGDMVKEFAEAAFALKPGETSAAAVRTQFGFHVIRAEERRKAAPPAMEELEEEVRAEIQREAYNQIVASLRQGAQVERFNMDGSKADVPVPTPAPAPSPAPPARK